MDVAGAICTVEDMTKGGNLAARYRPRRLSDVVGQQSVVATLKASAAAGTPPSQILLYGPSGLGKTTLARAFAAALLCEHPLGGDSCGECATCRRIAQGAHPDVVELDAASHGGIDQIRELAQRSQLVPLEGAWRITIIDEAHGLSGPGIQAFLKLLEEPPAGNVFILATTEPEKLGATIRGRCLLLRVQRPSDEELARNLEQVAAAEGVTLSPEAAERLVRASDEELGVRGTLMNLERVLGHGATNLDEAGVERALGAGSAVLADLEDRVARGDRRGALVGLRNARVVWDEKSLLAHLTAWARAGLDDAVARGDDLDVPLFRLRECLRTPATVGWTDVLVASLAEPRLVTHEVELTRLIAEACDVGDALAELLATSTRVGDALTDVEEERSLFDDVAQVAETNEPPAPQDADVDEESDVDVKERARVRILNAVAALDTRAALALARGGLTLGAGEMVTTGTYEPQVEQVLDELARDYGWTRHRG